MEKEHNPEMVALKQSNAPVSPAPVNPFFNPLAGLDIGLCHYVSIRC